MSRKTIEVDSGMINLAIDELSKLVLRLDKNPKKSRKEENTTKKIQEIRGYNTRLSTLCEIEKEYRVILIARKVIPIYIVPSIALMIFHTMNSIAIFILLAVTLVAATIVFSIPNAVQAKISFCASDTDIFQCFIKENDCETFSKNHPGTTCVRSKT
jgi:hypothetical protein